MLYLIESSDYYKIGYCKDIETRMRSYRTHNPDWLLIDVMEGDRTKEQFLHNLLKLYRYKLEWFYKDDYILEFWKDIKSRMI